MQTFCPVLPAQLPEQHCALAVQLVAATLQQVPLSTNVHRPVAGLQLSLVQLLLSLQVTGVATQPLAGAQESVVHSLPSSQVIAV